MKRTVIVAAVCGCLLVGSLYPRLILSHHVRVVDAAGNELERSEDLEEELPVKLEWGFLKLFR